MTRSKHQLSFISTSCTQQKRERIARMWRGEWEKSFYGFHFVVIIIAFAIIVTSNKIHIYSLNVLRVSTDDVERKKMCWRRRQKTDPSTTEDQISLAEFFLFSPFIHTIHNKPLGPFHAKQFFDYDKLKNYWAKDGCWCVREECEGISKCEKQRMPTGFVMRWFIVLFFVRAESLLCRERRKKFRKKVLLHY